MQQVKKELSVNNIGYLDATFRLILGIMALVPAFSHTPYHLSDLMDVSALLSIYPVITALYRWDPVYQLLHFRTTKETFVLEKFLVNQLRNFMNRLSSLTGLGELGHKHMPTTGHKRH